MIRPIRLATLAFTLGLLTAAESLVAQTVPKNLASFDHRKYHFGFLLSGNTSSFNIDFTPDFSFEDSLLSIENKPLQGFNLALLASLDLSPMVRLRFLPGLSFQDRGLLYRFRAEDGTIETEDKRTESVYIEFPLMLKLRTRRMGNFAPYALIGAKFGRDMQSQSGVSQSFDKDFIIKLKPNDSSLDVGAGADFFLPFFKFSVEMKTAFGFNNVLIQDDSIYSSAIEQLRTRAFIISICFEG
jgi:hypothetical protein